MSVLEGFTVLLDTGFKFDRLPLDLCSVAIFREGEQIKKCAIHDPNPRMHPHHVSILCDQSRKEIIVNDLLFVRCKGVVVLIHFGWHATAEFFVCLETS